MPSWELFSRENKMEATEPIPVKSIEEEYALIAGERCDCGGTFRVVRQSLILRPGQPCDLLEAVCVLCGGQRKFLFAIGSFFGYDQNGE